MNQGQRDYENRVQRLKKRGGTEVKELLRFARDLRSDEISYTRISKYLMFMEIWLGWIETPKLPKEVVNPEGNLVPFKGLPLDADEEHIKIFRILLQDSTYAPKSQSDFKQTVKRFFNWKKKPELVADIKTTLRKKDKRRFFRIMTPEEKEAVWHVVTDPRDQAFLAILDELNPRPQEVQALKLKHITFDENGAAVSIPEEGKTGFRRIRMVEKVSYLITWLERHPYKDDPESAVILKKSPYARKYLNAPLSIDRIEMIPYNWGINADLPYPLSIYDFRHAGATEKAQWMTEAQMKVYFGWEEDSTMPAIYIHLSGKDLDDPILVHYGLKEPDKAKKPTKCGRCKEINEPKANYCRRCGNALSDEAKKREVDARESEVEIIKEEFEDRLRWVEDLLEKKG